jgi:hypothetical protein
VANAKTPGAERVPGVTAAVACQASDDALRSRSGIGGAALCRRFSPEQPKVPFVPCPDTMSSSAIEPPSGGGSTLSSSSDGEPASGATF